MPSVGMRRNTRVFGARVLRSGRKLWTGPGVGKHIRVADGEDWIGLLDDSVNGGGDAVQSKENGACHDEVGLKEENGDIGNEDTTREPDGEGDIALLGSCDEGGVDRMWGAVYQRKRKRALHLKGSDSSGNLGKQRASDRMFGKQFFRKHCRKRIKRNPIQVTDIKSGFGLDASQGSLECGLLAAVVVESSCGSISWFSCFLNSVLRYMRRVRVGVDQLSAFLFSEPINHLYSSHGIHFLQDSASYKSSGVCKILDSWCSIPLFTLDFSSVPFCFVYLHSTLLLRCASLPNVLVKYNESLEANADEMIEDDEQPSCVPWEGDQSGSITAALENGYSQKRSIFRPMVSTPKVPGKTLQLRNGVASRCIQKRRSSLRSKRGRNYSAFGTRTAKRALVTDLFLGHDGRIPFSPLSSNRELRSPVQRSSTTNIKELKSSVVGLTHDIDSMTCSANILVIESDKGYREQGAIIKSEISSSDQWFLSVSRNGTRRFSLKPQSVMRPYCCNRITNAIIWKDDGANGWMLEFFSRQDWFVFKELHRECCDRNLRAPTVNVIPVPVVREVSGYAEDTSVPFRRPDSYITWKDDEVARALANGTVNYDLDFDDDEWLNKFNNEFCADNELDKFVSPDTFESIIYAFEKGLYCSPDEYSDAKTAADLCVDLARKEVLEAVHSYWLKKRKQKRSALVRVFQCNQPRKAQLLPKAVLRKKRSSKRLARRPGRGKRQIFLRALAARQNAAVDEETSILKVQEAKAAANRSEEGAILKRQKAQLLMQTAELATYKATMALRIAEASQVSESPEAAASFFLG